MSFLGHDDMFTWIGNYCPRCDGEGGIGLGRAFPCDECEGTGFVAFTGYCTDYENNGHMVFIIQRYNDDYSDWTWRLVPQETPSSALDGDLLELADAAAEIMSDEYGPCTPMPVKANGRWALL